LLDNFLIGGYNENTKGWLVIGPAGLSLKVYLS